MQRSQLPNEGTRLEKILGPKTMGIKKGTKRGQGNERPQEQEGKGKKENERRQGENHKKGSTKPPTPPKETKKRKKRNKEKKKGEYEKNQFVRNLFRGPKKAC